MVELPLWIMGVGIGVLLLVGLVGAWLLRRHLAEEPEYIEEYRMRTRRQEKTRPPGSGRGA